MQRGSRPVMGASALPLSNKKVWASEMELVRTGKCLDFDGATFEFSPMSSTFLSLLLLFSLVGILLSYISSGNIPRRLSQHHGRQPTHPHQWAIITPTIMPNNSTWYVRSQYFFLAFSTNVWIVNTDKCVQLTTRSDQLVLNPSNSNNWHRTKPWSFNLCGNWRWTMSTTLYNSNSLEVISYEWTRIPVIAIFGELTGIRCMHVDTRSWKMMERIT